jgi:DNA-binding response OmpR family regulator
MPQPSPFKPEAVHRAGPARRILVVEDEPDIAALLQLHLSELAEQVLCLSNGVDGLNSALDAGPWDAIVLDLRLPGMGGLEICRALRERGNSTPILMLTARSSELDRVLGLELGADDYLTKPFSLLELQARIRALWRRVGQQAALGSAGTQAPAEPIDIRAGGLHIHRVQRRAWLGPTELVLTPREFDLLWHFARQPLRAFSRAELLDQVWGYGHDGYDHTVNTHINRLRNKLGEGYIQTVWGVGYRFEAQT